MSILFTGFAPFGGADINPSWEAAKRMPSLIPGAQALLLPVEYGRCGDLLEERIKDFRPDFVLCAGLAAGRRELTPELIAVNLRLASVPDNAGAQYDGAPVDPGGPDAYINRLPFQTLLSALRDAAVSARLSLSCGAYVCNDLYYRALAMREQYGYQALFVHLPAIEDMDAQTAARGLKICAEVCGGTR